MHRNRILERNRNGEKAIGCSLVFPSAEIVELLGIAGFDNVMLDGEHGLYSPEAIDSMCRASDGAGLTVTARVPNIMPSTIITYLDRGVIGILGPHIDNADQARALVDACRYAPEGHRSWGGGRGTHYNDTDALRDAIGDRTAFMAEANKEMLVMAQIETVTAIENLDAILEVPGIDAFAFGPNDLAQSMGLVGQPDHPDVVEAMASIAEWVHAAGGKMSGDLSASIDSPSLILGAARAFVSENRS